jgi:hypothetical protein
VGGVEAAKQQLAVVDLEAGLLDFNEADPLARVALAGRVRG